MQPGVIYNYPIDGNLGTAVVVDRDGVGDAASLVRGTSSVASILNDIFKQLFFISLAMNSFQECFPHY